MSAPTRFHLSLNVSDLPKAGAFLERLFGQKPAKQREDYAKFELDSPPLVLSLEQRSPSTFGSLNHVGFRFPNAETLVDVQRRLELAGIHTQREDGVECCYAKQSKFWVHDLDHRLWEFYILEGDLDHRGAGQSLEEMIGAEAAAAKRPEREPVVWEHRMTEPFAPPAAACDEIRLRGSFNVPVTASEIAAILQQSFERLRPGGKLHLHQLTSDVPVSSEDLALPGRAASVKHVPVREELLGQIVDAGFRDVQLTKFGPKPCFDLGGIELRETMIDARRPLAESEVAHTVVYKGPFAAVQDDSGREYPRGERVEITEADWHALEAAGLADCFTRLAPPAGVPVSCGLTVL